ncbi:MAG TPA: hypothetical protein ENJ31_00715 [Anaerolineae bacterium]|nr:hypothetical protein [Anaerolineae bacterium]
MTQWSRIAAGIIGLLLLSLILSACGSAPVAQNWPGLTVAEGNVYVISGSPQQVYILDAETGQQKATFAPQEETKGVVYWSPVTVGGGLAFVGFAEDGKGTAGLYAFDPESGQELWHVPAGSLIIGAPTYTEGMVYFGSSDGVLHAVDVEAQRESAAFSFQSEEALWASPLAVEERLYVAGMDHFVYCLDAASGEVLWKTEVGGAMASRPLLSDGILYVGAFDGQVYALDAETGALVEGFHFQAGNWVWSEPLMADGLLYVTALDGKLYALDPASGDVVPPYPYDSHEIDGKKNVLRASPVQAGEFIIVATESGYVIAVQDAQRVWAWPGGIPTASVLTTPIVSGDKVYIALMNGQVQALEAETGLAVAGWPFKPPSE